MLKMAEFLRGGTSILGGRGLGPHIKIGGKLWGKARSGQVHQIRLKNLGSSVTIRRKSWEKSKFWGHI